MHNRNALQIVGSLLFIFQYIATGQLTFECGGYQNGTVGFDECVKNNSLWINSSACSYCVSCTDSICTCDAEVNCYSSNSLNSEVNNEKKNTDWWIVSGSVIGLMAVTILSAVIHISCRIAKQDKDIRKKELEKIRHTQEIINRRQVTFKDEEQVKIKLETVATCTNTTTSTNQNDSNLLDVIQQDESMDPSVTVELPDAGLIDETNDESQTEVVYQSHTNNNSQTVIKINMNADTLPLAVPKQSQKVHSQSIDDDQFNVAMVEIENLTPVTVRQDTLSVVNDQRFVHDKYESYQL